MKNTAKKHKIRDSGFTLIEALFAAMLLGLVIAALAAASGAFTMANGYGVDLSTAEFLIEEVRERTANIDFDTLNGLDGQTFSPPIDVSGAEMTDFGQFGQQVETDYVNSGDFSTPVTGPTDFIRVTVTVTKGGRPISSTSWIRAKL